MAERTEESRPSRQQKVFQTPTTTDDDDDDDDDDGDTLNASAVVVILVHDDNPIVKMLITVANANDIG